MDNEFDFQFFMPIQKVEGKSGIIYATVAQEIADHSNEIMDYASAKDEFVKWSAGVEKDSQGKSFGNVRVMHKPVVGGKVLKLEYDDNAKAVHAEIKVTDPVAKMQCDEGGYTGISIGGKYKETWPDPANPKLMRYTPIINEISLVDRPCIPTAVFKGRDFEFVRDDGKTEMRKFKVVQEADEDLKQVWQAKDGSTFEKKAEALQKNIDIAIAAVPDAISGALDTLKKAQAALASAAEPLEKAADAEPTKVAESQTVDNAVAKAEAFAKAVKEAALSKQLCDIPMIVDVIYSLDWLQGNLAMDSLFHDAETSTLPADLKTILASLCTFLKALVEAATSDIVADTEAAKALTLDQVESLRKFTGKPELLKDLQFPAPTIAPDPAALEKAAADVTKLTTELEATKAAKGDLEKTVTTLASGIEEMTKGIAELKASKDEMAKRIEHLEAQPEMAKGVKYTTLLNGHEGPAKEEVPVEVDIRKYNGMSPDEARAQMRKDSKRK